MVTVVCDTWDGMIHILTTSVTTAIAELIPGATIPRDTEYLPRDVWQYLMMARLSTEAAYDGAAPPTGRKGFPAMPLDPQVEAMRDQRKRDNVPPLYAMSLADARAADLAAIQESGGEPEPVREVADLTMAGPGGDLPLRLYRPASQRPLPALLYFFGGGWVLGTIDTADGVSRSLANSTGALVIVVGYRLAPEHPFPAAIDDCYAALRWVAGHAGEIGADPARLAVGGDSAGGNLAAGVTLLARSDGPPLAGQLLVYPNTDQLADDESMRAADDPFLFNRHSVAWYRRHYLADAGDAANPLASPLRAESLAGLPPALIITAEYDPLRDQGEAYARRLSDAGVQVELTRYPGMAHGFFTMAGTVDASRAAIAQAAAHVRAWFARS
jgi:acetyl esterase